MRVSLSASLDVEEHVSVVPTCTLVLGLILILDTAGFRLLIVRFCVSVAVPPLESVMVAVQVIMSVGAAKVESSASVEPVPKIVFPLLHS